MSESARIISIDALKEFRSALWQFAEKAMMALGDAEAELSRTLVWLETEQQTYWAGQIRKRQEILVRAKEALRQKQLFKDSSGRTPSAVDEEKAVRIAMKRLAEAEVKLAATRQWARRMHKELQNYKGGVQRFATEVQVDVPVAVGLLDKMAATLDSYVDLKAPSVELPVAAVNEATGMARPAEQPMPVIPAKPAQDQQASPPSESQPDSTGQEPTPPRQET